MNFDLKRDAFARTLITAHRGVWGGNIPCNTLDAFEVALAQGAQGGLVTLEVFALGPGQQGPGIEGKAPVGRDEAGLEIVHGAQAHAAGTGPLRAVGRILANVGGFSGGRPAGGCVFPSFSGRRVCCPRPA